jgi:hypothetical protein
VSDLVEFLLARIAEDEQAARQARGSRWTYDRESFAVLVEDGDHGWTVATKHRNVVNGEHDGLYDVDGEHIARHDPARVLREVEAKRRIVEECQSVLTAPVIVRPPAPGMGGDPAALAFHLALATQLQLAQPYADHPHFHPSWLLRADQA